MIGVIGLLVVTALALVGSALFSGMETGVYSLNRVQLRVRGQQNDPQARRLARLMDRSDELVVTTLFGTNLFDFIATAAVTSLMIGLAPPNLAEVYATAVLTPLVLVFGGMIPKDLFQRQSDRLMYPLSLTLLLFKRLAQATGLVILLRSITTVLLRWVDPARAAEREQLLPRTRMLRLLHEGAARGGLTVYQRDIIDRVLNLWRVGVGQVMTPRRRALLMPATISREDFLRAARMAHFSRIPMTGDDPARVIGIVNVYDVITDDAARPPREHLRPALSLPASESVSGALLKLQRARQVMAIVVDPTGRCLGLLTVKDLVEEIVGDLDVW